jgi:predicted DCC family thiol-disulfide oxidoreductase YuxK
MTDSTPTQKLPGPVLFFDGVCVMCNGIVEKLLRIDRARRFYFAPLQGETARAARQSYPQIPSELETMVYLEDGQVYLRSEGVLRAARLLPYPWKALGWFRILPRFITDLLYQLVARSRYRVFGKYEQCTVPAAEDRGRFLP